MIVSSLVRGVFHLEKISIEVQLIPGLPQMHFLGISSTLSKDIQQRILSAFNKCGYALPKGRQIVVDIEQRKNLKISRGIELAIAYAIGAQLGYADSSMVKNSIIYGNIGLDGKLSMPEDLSLWHPAEQILKPVLTGKNNIDYIGELQVVEHLFDENIERINLGECSLNLLRPLLPNYKFSKEIAKVISLIALGELKSLFIGPSGTGKTTVVQCLPFLAEKPNCKKIRELKKTSVYFSSSHSWLPVVQPHHSATVSSLIGGGVPIKAGDLMRAHGGILILDELLEFSDKIQSALREPIVESKINLSRGSYSCSLPCHFQLLATSNLCRCGFLSSCKGTMCSCSSSELIKYKQKLSGPFLDRFEVIVDSSRWSSANEGTETLSDILGLLEKLRAESIVNNPELSNPEFLLQRLSCSSLKDIFPTFFSRRRYISFLKVAYLAARLEGCREIHKSHLKYSLSLTNFNVSSLYS